MQPHNLQYFYIGCALFSVSSIFTYELGELGGPPFRLISVGESHLDT
jgi:hypothetical protein